MNLRHTTNETKQEQPWYRQTETTVPVPASVPAAQQMQAPPVQQQPTLFEPSAAERILARAGALQEIHGQLLSHEQIEAIAAEIGIKPEFVQLAIAQEKAQAVSESHRELSHETVHTIKPVTSAARVKITLASAGLIATYGIIATFLFLSADQEYPNFSTIISLVFVFPALLAFLLGIAAKSRRWGAAAGVMTAITAMATLMISFGLLPITLDTWALQSIAIMTGSGALLGVAGAQARRLVKRRQLSNRSRKVRVA